MKRLYSQMFIVVMIITILTGPFLSFGKESKKIETFYLLETDPILISIEHNKSKNNWTPVVVWIGGMKILNWMDSQGVITYKKEKNRDYIPSDLWIDLENTLIHTRNISMPFRIITQNNKRTRIEIDGRVGKAELKIEREADKGRVLLFGDKIEIGRFYLSRNKNVSPQETIRIIGSNMINSPKYFNENGMISLCESNTERMRGREHTLWANAKKLREIQDLKELDLRISNNPPVTISQITNVERNALIALYNSTDGDSWFNNTNWKKADGTFNDVGTENTWQGIRVENDQVVRLDFWNNNLDGTIPPEIGNLTNLTDINFGRNRLEGNLPPEIGNLPNLNNLDLWGCDFTGSIPPELAYLTNLERINLSQNNFSGSIPPELGNLVNMRWLYLGDNELEGSIPPELSNLANLEQLSLGGNELTGSLPPELGNMANLRDFDAWSNKLSGIIPPEFENLLDIERLSIRENDLTGSIPPGLGNLPSIKDLQLQNNKLTGSIPPELANLTTLDSLDLNGNQLTGDIPPQFGNFINLETLSLGRNDLSGNIPPALGNMANMRDLGLWSNNLTGNIPPELANLANLGSLNLEDNQLTGDIPPELGNLTNLDRLDLDWNKLEGNIPPELGNLVNIDQLELRGNELTGEIPPELGNLINLEDLLLSDNNLTGSIPTQFGNFANLRNLELRYNQLTGEIPPGLGNLSNLDILDLESNQLTGDIPPELGNLTNLDRLDLDWNKLEGNIPPELGNLVNIDQLELRGNELTGEIPPELGNLINLEDLLLSDNNLTGSIPPELGDLINLENLELDDNNLTGSIPPELGDLENLEELHLRWNKLNGNMPPELGNLGSLELIGLESNALMGSVPQELANLTNLIDGRQDFQWNALYTNDDALRNFLNIKQSGGDWESSQTVAPVDVTAEVIISSNNLLANNTVSRSVKISWTPIEYDWDDGGYKIFYSTTPGGPWTISGITVDKYQSEYEIANLAPGISNYFYVKTQTDPHGNNNNVVLSEYSAVVSVIIPPLISGSVKTAGDVGILDVTITFSNEGGTALTDTDGLYSQLIDYSWSGTVTPTKTHYTFDPPVKNYTNVTSDQADQDFIGVRNIYSPQNFTGEKVLNRSAFRKEYLNVLAWQANPDNVLIDKYRIYIQYIQDEENQQIDLNKNSSISKRKKLINKDRELKKRIQDIILLVELDSIAVQYLHRNVDKNKQYTYYLVAVDYDDNEGEAASVTVK